jgi:2,4-dienoyl-CoA reductase-like NADH-dependent reductase (Old Yellow Enzyme family)
MLEVTDACIDVWGADRVGMHLAPRRDAHDMGDSTPRDLRLRGTRTGQARHRLHLRARSDRRGPPRPAAEEDLRRRLHRQRKDDEVESAEQLLTSGDADAVAFGQWFIANPDLPERLKRNAPLNPLRPDKFYGSRRRGLYGLSGPAAKLRDVARCCTDGQARPSAYASSVFHAYAR